jgi:hypothetical protein
MFPLNLEHSNSTVRFDLIALYGPTVLYHLVDSCFCPECTPLANNQLKIADYRKQKAALIKNHMGDSGIDTSKTVSMRGTQKTI